jgi:hypothetical protein
MQWTRVSSANVVGKLAEPPRAAERSGIVTLASDGVGGATRDDQSRPRFRRSNARGDESPRKPPPTKRSALQRRATLNAFLTAILHGVFAG